MIIEDEIRQTPESLLVLYSEWPGAFLPPASGAAASQGDNGRPGGIERRADDERAAGPAEAARGRTAAGALGAIVDRARMLRAAARALAVTRRNWQSNSAPC
ncbi:MAG: hypothetical protein H6934_04690 [Burkholderiaceae bacterium]|nr:hypothetical protein [Burkholderiaceae bacterium]